MRPVFFPASSPTKNSLSTNFSAIDLVLFLNGGSSFISKTTSSNLHLVRWDRGIHVSESKRFLGTRFLQYGFGHRVRLLGNRYPVQERFAGQQRGDQRLHTAAVLLIRFVRRLQTRRIARRFVPP